MKNRTLGSWSYLVSFTALLFFYDLALNVTSKFLNATTLIPTSQEKVETNKASLLRGTEILLKKTCFLKLLPNQRPLYWWAWPPFLQVLLMFLFH